MISFYYEDVNSPIKPVHCSVGGKMYTAFLIPNAQTKDAVTFPYATNRGIYIYFGKSVQSTTALADEAYVGQGDNWASRINGTHSGIEDWIKTNRTETVVFTSDENFWTRTDLDYLENEFHEKIKTANRYTLQNTSNHLPQKPIPVSNSSMNQFTLTQFTEIAGLILRMYGYPAFDPK